MKLWEIVKDTFRECLGKKILIIFFLISTLGILGLLFLFDVDIAGNRAAISALFGEKQDSIALFELKKIIIIIESYFAVTLYTLGIFLSVFATADLIPSMMTKGRLELYLARPISRPMLMMGKLAGATGVVAVNIIYAIAGIWLVLGIKTGVWNVSFLCSIVTIIFMFAVLYTVMMLTSILVRSTAMTVIVTYMVIVINLALAQKENFLPFISSNMFRQFIEIFYWIIPKYHETSIITKNVVAGNAIESWTPAINSLLIALIVMNITVFIFSKKDL